MYEYNTNVVEQKVYKNNQVKNNNWMIKVPEFWEKISDSMLVFMVILFFMYSIAKAMYVINICTRKMCSPIKDFSDCDNKY